jgi:LPS export ABC transporter protein LptC
MGLVPRALENTAAGCRNGSALMPKKFYLPLLMFLALIAACGSRDGKKDDIPAVPEQAIEKFSVTETEKGKPHWVLDAASAQILENEKKVFLQAPHVTFFENGEKVSTLTAERGRMNTESYDMWGEGKCVLDTAKGERLETSNLHYQSDAKKIVTREKVKLTRPDEIIYGEGMEASPDLENITIKKQRVEMRNKEKL